MPLRHLGRVRTSGYLEAQTLFKILLDLCRCYLDLPFINVRANTEQNTYESRSNPHHVVLTKHAYKERVLSRLFSHPRSLNCLDRKINRLQQPFRCLLSIVSQNRVTEGHSLSIFHVKFVLGLSWLAPGY